MKLDNENYFSPEASKQFMSVSQYKDFVGTWGMTGCEAYAMARINGEVEEPTSDALLMGSYVDAHYSGEMEQFTQEHPEIYTATSLKKGVPELSAKFKKADEIIARCEADPLFSQYMSGDKQVIMTGELFGTEWKIKMDSYFEGKAIVDLKVMSSLSKLNWVKDLGYLDFVRFWNYDVQGAIYQEIVYQNTGKRLPFYIAGVSKEEEPDIRIIHVTDNYLEEAMNMVKFHMARILDVKEGREEPVRCDTCNYCRKTRVLTEPISILDLTASL